MGRGSITGLIGPNGAGKTTSFSMIAGALAPSGGTVRLEGEDVTGLGPHALYARGLVRTFQIPQEFARLTVRENLMTAAPAQPGERIWTTWLQPRAAKAREAQVRAEADEALAFLGLSHLADDLAGSLSGGQRSCWNFGRTMMARARLVLLDEPGAGVNPTLMNRIADMIEELRPQPQHDLLSDRARHGPDRAPLRPGDRAGRGARAGRGPDVGDPQRRPGDRRLFRRPGRGRRMSVLALWELHAGYGGAAVLHGVSLTVEPGEIVVVVGPNGAGKSTAMKAVFGLLDIHEGHVRLGETDITGRPPAEVVASGVAYVPQVGNVFVSLSVEENLEMGAYLRRDDFRPRIAEIYEMFPDLAAKRRAPAGSLSGGQRQMVAMGKALMTEPKLLMLDEPTAGLSAQVSRADLRDGDRDQRHRRPDPDGRAERQAGAGDRASRLCAPRAGATGTKAPARGWRRTPRSRACFLALGRRPEMWEFVNFYFIPGVILGCVYALGAMGISLTFGILRFANFAHGRDDDAGRLHHADAGLGDRAAALGAAIPAMAVVAAITVGLDRAVFRPHRAGQTIILVIASFGLMLMIRSAVQFFWGTKGAGADHWHPAADAALRRSGAARAQASLAHRRDAGSDAGRACLAHADPARQGDARDGRQPRAGALDRDRHRAGDRGDMGALGGAGDGGGGVAGA